MYKNIFSKFQNQTHNKFSYRLNFLGHGYNIISILNFFSLIDFIIISS